MTMKKEKRNLSFKDIEVRSAQKENKKYIEGIIPYNSRSLPMWGTTEIIDRTAFNKTLADKTEVRALYNHDDSKVLGSTKSGTLELENTENGLICRCELPNTSYANDAWEIINRGDCQTMSFGFIPQKWDDDTKTKTRTLKEVKLLETSFCVAFPAYPETTSIAQLRGLNNMEIDIEQLNEILEKQELTDEDKNFVKDIIENLSNFIKDDEAVEKEPSNDTPQKDTLESENNLRSIQLQIETELLL